MTSGISAGFLINISHLSSKANRNRMEGINVRLKSGNRF